MTKTLTDFEFEILHTSKRSRARVGRIHTPHGVIDTPSFVGVGTHGAIKALTPEMLESIELPLLFCNTYHLMLEPGTKVVEAAGGLHRYIGRSGPIITDSGGFQVFSLAYGSVTDELKSAGKKREGESAVLKITEDGVLFRSYRDGSKILLTPESSVQAQKELGADIIIPFDELPPYHVDPSYLAKSLERTHRWEMRSLMAHLDNPKGQAMYGVIHGGISKELREKSATFLGRAPFDGFAIGGSFGKTKEQMAEMIGFTLPFLPKEKPVHLLGMGDTTSIAAAIPLGIDTFDSAYPTRAARHGSILLKDGHIQISQGKFKEDFSPLDPECGCSVCRSTTRAYLHHLFKAHELSGMTLATYHNLYAMTALMARYRNLILEDQI